MGETKKSNSGWWGLLAMIGIGWWWLSRPPKKVPEPTSSALVVPATILYSDFEKNEVAAEAKYTDKTLKVTGRVTKVEKVLGTVQVRIAAGLGDYPYVIAELDEGAEGAAVGVQVGAPVAVQCTGGRKVVDLRVRDCIFVNP